MSSYDEDGDGMTFREQQGLNDADPNEAWFKTAAYRMQTSEGFMPLHGSTDGTDTLFIAVPKKVKRPDRAHEHDDSAYPFEDRISSAVAHFIILRNSENCEFDFLQIDYVSFGPLEGRPTQWMDEFDWFTCTGLDPDIGRKITLNAETGELTSAAKEHDLKKHWKRICDEIKASDSVAEAFMKSPSQWQRGTAREGKYQRWNFDNPDDHYREARRHAVVETATSGRRRTKQRHRTPPRHSHTPSQIITVGTVVFAPDGNYIHVDRPSTCKRYHGPDERDLLCQGWEENTDVTPAQTEESPRAHRYCCRTGSQPVFYNSLVEAIAQSAESGNLVLHGRDDPRGCGREEFKSTSAATMASNFPGMLELVYKRLCSDSYQKSEEEQYYEEPPQTPRGVSRRFSSASTAMEPSPPAQLQKPPPRFRPAAGMQSGNAPVLLVPFPRGGVTVRGPDSYAQSNAFSHISHRHAIAVRNAIDEWNGQIPSGVCTPTVQVTPPFSAIGYSPSPSTTSLLLADGHAGDSSRRPSRHGSTRGMDSAGFAASAVPPHGPQVSQASQHDYAHQQRLLTRMTQVRDEDSGYEGTRNTSIIMSSAASGITVDSQVASQAPTSSAHSVAASEQAPSSRRHESRNESRSSRHSKHTRR